MSKYIDINKLDKCYVIAEIGVNHNGDINLARKLIDEAKIAGADAVKFQTYKAESLASKKTPKVAYQKKNDNTTDSHLEMLQKLELSKSDHFILKKYCEDKNIEFISTPYDVECAKFLNEELCVGIFKTASADIVDIDLHEYIAQTGKPNLISVGMATLGEVEEVCEIYRKYNSNNIALLHCVSNYPCSDESINMRVVDTLRQCFGYSVGYSDHSTGAVAAILSIAHGCKIIEKHFTINKDLDGPDHKASSTPVEIKYLVESIRRSEKMLGSKIKSCQIEEMEMARISRKSIHLACDIEQGQILDRESLVLKRPGTGLYPKYMPLVLGATANKKLLKDEMLNLADIK